MVNREVWIVGASGHAKVVISTLRAAGFDPRGLYDDDPGKVGLSILGVPVLGNVDQLGRKIPGPLAHGIGGNAIRAQLLHRLPEAEWLTAVHPAAWVHPEVRLGSGTMVFAGVIIQPDAQVGSHVILNTCCSVDHDCVIGDFAHVAPGGRLAGGVGLGQGAFMGLGSCAIPGVSIGDWTTIGAGAVVVRDLAPNVTAVGAPAKPIKERPEGWHR